MWITRSRNAGYFSLMQRKVTKRNIQERLQMLTLFQVPHAAFASISFSVFSIASFKQIREMQTEQLRLA